MCNILWNLNLVFSCSRKEIDKREERDGVKLLSEKLEENSEFQNLNSHQDFILK